MKLVFFACLAVVLFFPATGLAQSEPQPAAPASLAVPTTADAPAANSSGNTADQSSPIEMTTPKATHPLRIPMTVWAASVAADQATTYLFSSRYGDMLHERNFLVRGLDAHPAALVAAGTAIDAATGWVAYRLLRNHPRLAAVVFYGAAAYRGYLTAYNIRMMRRAQAIRVATPR